MYMIIPVSLSMEEGERVAGDGGVLLCVVIAANVRGHLKEERGKTGEYCSSGNRRRVKHCSLNVLHDDSTRLDVVMSASMEAKCHGIRNMRQHKAENSYGGWGVPGVRGQSWCRLSPMLSALENHLSDEWVN
ncbi:hypothetical protein E2C01_003289 [Portunus trituberculatus]|uniref:Uncharacterized protein n=1 Tax=Portunus trituberculatus TaxID=210409 RepID=A0A5B7CMI3_PORTR|nr:hypothetical protein [Portunus trituberculatus]